MIKNLFTMSEKGTSEYCCCVVRIGEVKPIEGSDFLGQTLINGESIVVRKDSVKEGDLMFYASNETQLNKDFLSVNNLFEISEKELNSNYKEVKALIDEGNIDEAKKKVGFFNKHGRVKMIRLRGIPSMGFIFSQSEMAKYVPEVANINLEEMLNIDFDTIKDKLFIKAYVPFVNTPSSRSKGDKRQNKVKRFNRMVPGQFYYHYDTNPLQKNIHRIKPTDVVTISVKEHGTSAVFANILTKKPKRLNSVEKIINKKINKEIRILRHTKRYDAKYRNKKRIEKLKKSVKLNYTISYGNVYASRNVIKNEYINPNVGGGFYKKNVWEIFNEYIKDHISEGMTLYGEILGFVPQTNEPIQGAYDYGCKSGEAYFMPYRITTENKETKNKKEWEVSDVHKWTVNLVKNNPHLKGIIKPINILYHGTLADLYPHVSISEHWNENILQELKNDKELLGMELDEPLCKNKVPREGVCVRIDNDLVAECFKLKCARFLLRESKEIDNGNIDMEMKQAYT